MRERRSMTALPPTYYLHVWWARRPLVAARAAILASLLPETADHANFKHLLGIHGDPVAAKLAIERARRTGIRVEDPYGYPRAFSYVPDENDRAWLASFGEQLNTARVLDPTAGGGSIPFEAVRIGLPTLGNDLNPVASLLLHATVRWPAELGMAVRDRFLNVAMEWRSRVETRLVDFFPQLRAPEEIDLTYLWARTVRCPYCEGLVPLSPNWRLAPDGTGVRLLPRSETDIAKRVCDFEIVGKVAEQSPGTVADGDATCPFPDCGRVIDGDEVKRQAQSGQLGEQLYAVVIKRRVVVKTKTGKDKVTWLRSYRAPRAEDDISEEVSSLLAEKLPEWEAMNYLPTEEIDELTNYERGHRLYGVMYWRDMFSPRQLLCHGTSVEVFHNLLAEANSVGPLDEVAEAAFCYLALALDTMLNYANRSTRWDSVTSRVRSIFDRHGFAFIWSYAEMVSTVEGLGFDWAIDKTGKCIEELVELSRPQEARSKGAGLLPFSAHSWTPPPITLSCKSGDSLDHIAEGSVDCVVMDPPYYDNVMYAELSDFFYVWLKRTAGHVLPELFRRQLTDKENEAVANPAKFRDQKGAKALAGRDYQERMAAIFTECHRVLKPDGIMTLMFTHKATGAWDALTKGLMEAGFTITASWPINTEAEGSLHIKDKAAANSTIFLACRPRIARAAEADTLYWEDVEPLVAKAVRSRVEEFQSGGIRGVDLYLASFGPALQKFSEFWPLKRGTPRSLPPSHRRKQKQLFEEEWDPYAVSPEDALDAARREVKRWRLEQLTHKQSRTELDPRTSWFVLAWDAFEAPVFPYDEALRLARAVGVDLDHDVVGSLAAKKGSDLVLWDSAQRAAKGALGPADGSRGMIDSLHHAAHRARSRTLEDGREILERAGVISDAAFAPSLLAVLEVLPVSAGFSGVELPTDVAGAGSDFEALEKLRRLAFSQQVEEPRQLGLWQERG